MFIFSSNIYNLQEHLPIYNNIYKDELQCKVKMQV
jgi:hypothetical protein